MTDTKHTPGPWEAEYSSPNNYSHGHWRIYSKSQPLAFGMRHWLATTTSHISAQSNARLIAAAPDLLTACQTALIAATEPCPTSNLQEEVERVRNILRTAIAKATGQEA